MRNGFIVRAVDVDEPKQVAGSNDEEPRRRLGGRRERMLRDAASKRRGLVTPHP